MQSPTRRLRAAASSCRRRCFCAAEAEAELTRRSRLPAARRVVGFPPWLCLDGVKKGAKSHITHCSTL